MLLRLFCASLFFLPAAPKGRIWSDKRPISIAIPANWELLARDQDTKVFELRGPKLGNGTPRGVLQYVGPAQRRSLDAVTKQIVASVKKRPRWHVVAQAPKRIGAFPARRVALKFQLDDKRRGRARFTVALLGDSYYVFEMSAEASRFPGPAFDRLEQTILVRWQETSVAGLKVAAPAGWSVAGNGERATIEGPQLGAGRSVVFVAKGAGPPLPEAAPAGPKVSFLGKRRPTRIVEREVGDGVHVRQLVLEADGIAAAVMMPQAVWDDLFPIVEEILDRARRP